MTRSEHAWLDCATELPADGSPVLDVSYMQLGDFWEPPRGASSAGGVVSCASLPHMARHKNWVWRDSAEERAATSSLDDAIAVVPPTAAVLLCIEFPDFGKNRLPLIEDFFAVRRSTSSNLHQRAAALGAVRQTRLCHMPYGSPPASPSDAHRPHPLQRRGVAGHGSAVEIGSVSGTPPLYTRTYNKRHVRFGTDNALAESAGIVPVFLPTAWFRSRTSKRRMEGILHPHKLWVHKRLLWVHKRFCGSIAFVHKY